MTALSETKKYQAYPEYKDSGVEWVGDIPVKWEMWKLSHAYREIGSGTTPPTTSDEWFGGDIPWVTTGELRETVINGTKKNVSKKTIDTFSALRIYPAGSVAMAMYGATIGRLGIFGVDATTNQACCVMTASDVIDNKYLFYWLWAFRQDIINLSSGGGQPNINQEKVASLKISAPIIDEQTQIANFLDHETAKIDTLIEKQQQLIKLLKEKRQAVISHAVTKGLNPQAPMKDSGVEWLGEVPEHWDVMFIKHLSQVKRGASPRPIDDPKYFDDNGEYAWTRIADVSSAGMYLTTTTQRLSSLGASLSVRLEANELFLSIAGTVGKPCITVSKACIHDGFVYFPTLDINNKFLYYIFDAGQAYLGLGKMGTQLNLNTDTVGGIKIGLPPRNEIEQIIKYIEHQNVKHDKLIERAVDSIHLMQERRTALISAVVTGKIDVRNWQAPTSQEQALEQTA
ncbi:restriction endonuclease subunit S [Vibrio zhugei]|uniref:Restriction endonuclease subunit S n=1 Tax=Vibrio zhugei TaxID=2479546 RepID=A0ABV7C4H4_9VIBR|nr:restriction endonuclease subunit S [Vibrio zhugei]